MSTDYIVVIVIVTAQVVTALVTYYYRNNPDMLKRIQNLEKIASDLAQAIENTQRTK